MLSPSKVVGYDLPGVDVLKKFHSSIAMLSWNKALLLVETSRITLNIQSEYFTIKNLYDISS